MATSRRMRTATAGARAASAPPTPPRRVEEQRSRGYVSTAMSQRREVIDETSREVDGERKLFVDGEQPTLVKVGLGMTVNLGNFESLRVDVGITVPCHEDEIDEAYEQASNWVADRIGEEQARWLGTGNERKG